MLLMKIDQVFLLDKFYWTISVKLYCLWLKFIKNNSSRKRAIDKNFQRILEKVIRVKLKERKELFTETYWESLKGQDCPNGIVSWYKFTENFCKYNVNRIISVFDKNSLKWRIRVNPYCPWSAFVKNISK